MAVLYVRSTNATVDADNGSTWALAKTTLAGAFAVAAAGDTIYVSQAHNESQAGTITLTSPGTAALPCKVICANDGAEPPTATATTGVISNTGASSSIAFVGFAYLYGLTLSAGSSANPQITFNPGTPHYFKLDSCKLIINSTGTGAGIALGISNTGSDDSGSEWINTTVQFGSTAQGITIRCPFKWKNTSSAIAGATIPTILFKTPSNGNTGVTEVTGVDFSAMGSGKSLIDVSVGNWGYYLIQNCKLGTSASLTSGTVPGIGGAKVTVINCDAGSANYKLTYTDYAGTISEEISIIKTGGATNGTTPISYKMVTTAYSSFLFPLISKPIFYWNETTGSSVTVTIPVVTNNVTLTEAEAWIEVEYLGTTGYPISSEQSDRSVNLIASISAPTSEAAQATDAISSWPSAPGTPIKQSLSATFTPQIKGMIAVRVVLAKPSTTMYYDPLVLASSGRQYQTIIGFSNEGVASGGEQSHIFIG